MKPDFFFWWSIVSTIAATAFLIWDFWQLVSYRKEQKLHKGQVKLWQHHANGINHGLILMEQSINQNHYSSLKDVQQTIKSLNASTYSLFTSLNEERLFSDEEVKKEQLEQKRQLKELMDGARRSRTEQKTPTTTSLAANDKKDHKS